MVAFGDTRAGFRVFLWARAGNAIAFYLRIMRRLAMNRKPGVPGHRHDEGVSHACSLLPAAHLFPAPLSGCAELNISNPFETKSSDGSEVYFDQFPDVPIPRDMSVDAKRSLISVAQDGTKTGSSPSKARG